MKAEKPSFGQVIKNVGAAAKPNNHPDDQQLIDHSLDLLDATAAEAVQDHLVICRRCTQTMLHLGRAPQSVPESERLSQDEKDARFRRMIELPQFQEKRSQKRAPHRMFQFAALFFMSTTLVLAWRLLQPAAVAPDLEPAVNIAIVDRRPADTRDRGETAATLPLTWAGDQDMVLLLHPPAHEAYPEYAVAIQGESTENLWVSGGFQPVDGLFNLIVPAGSLRPGVYRVTLLGVDGDQREQLADFGDHRVLGPPGD